MALQATLCSTTLIWMVAQLIMASRRFFRYWLILNIAMSLMSSWTLAHLQAGYNAGDASTFFELPESGTVLANFLDHYSNFDTTGRYVYRVSPTEFLTGNKFTNLLCIYIFP